MKLLFNSSEDVLILKLIKKECTNLITGQIIVILLKLTTQNGFC